MSGWKMSGNSLKICNAFKDGTNTNLDFYTGTNFKDIPANCTVLCRIVENKISVLIISNCSISVFECPNGRIGLPFKGRGRSGIGGRVT